MSETTYKVFLKQFLSLLRKRYQSMFIKPLEGETLIRTMTTYSKLGLFGCVGSNDDTFVAWSGTSANLCSGDKGSGVLFEVVVVAISGSH